MKLQNREMNFDALHHSVSFSVKDLPSSHMHASQHVTYRGSFSYCIKSSLCWWHILSFKKSVALKSLVLKNLIDFQPQEFGISVWLLCRINGWPFAGFFFFCLLSKVFHPVQSCSSSIAIILQFQLEQELLWLLCKPVLLNFTL